MDDLSNKLSELLSNPESLKTIMGLASSFMGAQEEKKEPAPAASEVSIPTFEELKEKLQEQKDKEEKSDLPAANPLGALLGGARPDALLQIASHLTGHPDRRDNRVALLLAMRPFLCEERRRSIDTALQLLKFYSIAAGMKDIL